MDKKSPFVFVSYAHRNCDAVMPAINEMQSQGITLWYDNGIAAGSEWPEFVAEKVVACDKFVLFVSKAYLESQNCKRELNFAISRKKEILSIFLEEVTLSPGMEMQLGSYQAIFRNRFPDHRKFCEAVSKEPFFDSCRGTSQTPENLFAPQINELPVSKPDTQLPIRNKKLAAVLAIVLGSFGVHKFYFRQYLFGLIYLALCWTYVPLVVSIVEGIMLLVQPDEVLERRYKCRFQ